MLLSFLARLLKNLRWTSGLHTLDTRYLITSQKLTALSRRCSKCGSFYLSDKSKSSLRLTYCGILCEVSDLGFHINSWIDNKPEMVVKKSELEPVKTDSIIPMPTGGKYEDNQDDDYPGGELVPV